FMQEGTSNPPHHLSQVDLLTGTKILGMPPQYSQQMLTRIVFSNVAPVENIIPPTLVQNNPFLSNAPPYLNMYSKSPQGDMFSSLGMFTQPQGFPYDPANTYAMPYQHNPFHLHPLIKPFFH
ncbi:hypothetical protein KI387_027041, partial [Taxus chinensis]